MKTKYTLKLSLAVFITIISCFLFSFVQSDSTDFFTTVSKADFALKVTVTKKDQEAQWTQGYTDYQVHATIGRDYKGNFKEDKLIFNHRANGKTIAESKSNQLIIGDEYIILLDSTYSEISTFEVKNGEIKQITQKVFILENTYNSVERYSETLESKIIPLIKHQ